MKKTKLLVFMLMFVLFFDVLGVPSVVQAKKYSENGTWKRVIKGTNWYFDVNDYTSREPGEKYYGVVYIYKGSASFKPNKEIVQAEYFKTGKNKFKIKYAGGAITFRIQSDSIVLKQNNGSVKGTKLNGKFQLVRRHYS